MIRKSLRTGTCRTITILISTYLAAWPTAAQQLSPSRPYPFMQEMEQPFRELRAQIKDASQNLSSLDLIRRIQHESLAAKNTVPPMIEKLPPEKYRIQLLAYRKLMLTLIRQELDLEGQLLVGDQAKAAAILAEIVQTRRAGHRAFTSKGPLD
jgi:hypothetical protein